MPSKSYYGPSSNELLGAAGAIRSIGGSFQNAENRGIRREDRKKEAAFEERVGYIGQAMADDGISPDDIDGFDPAVKTEAIRRHNYGLEQQGLADYNTAAKKYAGMTNVDEILNDKVTTLSGKKAQMEAVEAWRQTDDAKRQIGESRKADEEKQYAEIQGTMAMVDRARAAGDKTKEMDLLAHIVNNSNNAYKAEILPNGKIRTYITENGKDLPGEEITKDDLYNMIANTNRKQFAVRYHASAEDASRKSAESFKDPQIWADKNGNQVRVVDHFNTRTNKVDYREAYDQNGKLIDGMGEKELFAGGYTHAGQQKTVNAAIAKTNATKSKQAHEIAKVREKGQADLAKTREANSEKRITRETAESTQRVINQVAELGIQMSINPDTEMVESQPMTKAQAIQLKAAAAENGLEVGIIADITKKTLSADTTKYRVVGVNRAQPGRQGLGTKAPGKKMVASGGLQDQVKKAMAEKEKPAPGSGGSDRALPDETWRAQYGKETPQQPKMLGVNPAPGRARPRLDQDMI